jgi:gas vesicle protein
MSDDYGGGHMAKDKKKGGLLVGLLIGAGVGLLLAPKTGKELRDQLFGGSRGDQGSRFSDAMDAGRESAEKRAETLRSKIEETRQRLRDQMG